MSTNTTNSALHHQLSTTLLAAYSLPVSPTWLSTFLAFARNPLPPLPALTSTARFRILASDIRTSLAPTNDILPVDWINDVTIKERRLPTDIVVQVLDITDIGTSKWSQIEAIERVERREEVRGREVIRNVPIMNDDDDDGSNARNRTQGNDGTAEASASASAANTNGNSNSNASNSKKSPGPHKLILQDAKGTNATAFEMIELPQLYIGEGGMSIGCKLLLKQGTLVRRGMIMLMPDSATVMGGKIESWDKKWREERKGRLTAEIDALQATGSRVG